jgi:hypothetical protein
MKAAQRYFVFCLAFAVTLYAQGNTFDKIRYNGGTLQTKVNPKDWDNELSVSPDEIRLILKDGQVLRIAPQRVHGLSYGQEAHRRVGTMIALGILVAPAALFGLFHKTRLHYVGIEFTDEQGKKSGVLLQAHKDNYRAVLMALRGVTRAPISVSEEDRKFVPTGIETIAAQPAEPTPAAAAAPPTQEAAAPAATNPLATGATAAQPPAPATPAPELPDNDAETLTSVTVKSSPPGADITVNGKYMGSTPSDLRLPAGDHTINIEKAGFRGWQRTIAVLPGGNITIDAVLEAPSKGLRLEELLDLLQAGVSNSRLVELVRERGVAFRAELVEEERLRAAGAQDQLLQTVREASAGR